MKVLVVHPPLAFPASPYAAIPILLGQLRNRGINADSIDMNVEFLKEILSVEYIKKTKTIIEKMYEENPENKEFRDVVESYLHKDNIIDEIIKNNENLYNDLIDINVTEEKKKRLFAALPFCFLPKFPSSITFYLNDLSQIILERNPIFKYNYDEIMEKCSSRDKNIYIDFFEKKIKEINIEQYDLVAITVPFETHLYPALTLAKIIKEQTSAKVALGGVLINGTIESYIKHDDMFDTFTDVFLLGEGERALPEYVEFLEGKRPLNKVSGAVYKEDAVVKNNGFSRIEHIDEIKPPSYQGICSENYRNFNVSLEFSKGCYWGKCAYCYSNRQKRYHLVDAKKAVDVIENIVNEHGHEKFHILDDSIPPRFAEKFADELIKRNLKIKYFFFLRFEKAFNKKLLEKMQRSGLESIFFGLESASPRILKLMNKGIDIKQAERILQDCYELNIEVSVGVMFGYPTETEEDIVTTLEFLKKYSHCMAGQNLFYFTLLKSSGLMSNLSKVGIVKTIDYEEFSEYLIHKGPCITRKRLNEILREHGFAALNIYPKW